jgi:hypothetical protein
MTASSGASAEVLHDRQRPWSTIAVWWREIGAHPLMAIGAIVVGWATQRVIAIALSQLPLLDWLVDPIVHAFGSHPFTMLWATELWFRPVECAIYLASGWTVGVLHRRHRGAMVFAFTVALLLMNVASTVPRVWGMISGDASVPPAHWLVAIVLTALPLVALVGGRRAGRASGTGGT